VVPRFAGRTEQAKVSRAKSDIASIGIALDLYELDIGKYPTDLKELLSAPSDAKDSWTGPYLKKGLPKDPWGSEYEYKSPSDHADKGQDYDLYSRGADRQGGNEDDVKNWE